MMLGWVLVINEQRLNILFEREKSFLTITDSTRGVEGIGKGISEMQIRPGSDIQIRR